MAASTGDARQVPSSQLAKDICVRYIPVTGAVSSLLFSSNIMSPNLFRSYFGSSETIVANCLWFNAHIGTGIYVYTRKHLASAPVSSRLIYSAYGALLYNFGAVLLWATSKAVLPKCNFTRCLFGFGSGAALLLIGKKYLEHIDNQLAVTSGDKEGEEEEQD